MKLTYTKEMEKQDELWQDAKEDNATMLLLHKQIENEAKSKGFKGAVITYQAGDGEVISEVFENEKDWQNSITGEFDAIECYARCDSLIESYEYFINL